MTSLFFNSAGIQRLGHEPGPDPIVLVIAIPLIHDEWALWQKLGGVDLALPERLLGQGNESVSSGNRYGFAYQDGDLII